MKISYNKLWKRMKENNMKKSDLARAAGITPYSMAKLNKALPISMAIMINLCKIFHCDIGDLMEVIEEE